MRLNVINQVYGKVNKKHGLSYIPTLSNTTKKADKVPSREWSERQQMMIMLVMVKLRDQQ